MKPINNARTSGTFRTTLIFMSISVSLISCSRELTECNGPLVDKSQLQGLRASLFAAGPTAQLLVPNPMEAAQSTGAKATDRSLLRFADGLHLPDLIQPSRLENGLVRVRLTATSDDVTTLATPNAKGEFSFDVSDPHYSETMGYYGVTNMLRYVQALGFSLLTNRPLYVMVRGENTDGSVNAYYEHHFFESQEPRQIKLFGTGEHAPGMDRDVFWHETGHFVNESVSADVGFDRAGEMGAVYTEGSALHECLADHIAESLADKSFIGKWIAPNFEGYTTGAPLRSAEDLDGKTLLYNDVAVADGKGVKPERYAVAEWCTRVLWQLRKSFVTEDADTGSFFSDRLVLSAVSQLPKDASFRNFHEALVSADQKLHCGLHQRSIEEAFSSRGFDGSADRISEPLTLYAEPYATQVDSGSVILFKVRVANPNGQVARNVRLVLESQSSSFVIAQPMQGLGDLAPGAEILVNAGSDSLSDLYSPAGLKDSSTQKAATFTLKVVPENGPETSMQGKVP